MLPVTPFATDDQAAPVPAPGPALLARRGSCRVLDARISRGLRSPSVGRRGSGCTGGTARSLAPGCQSRHHGDLGHRVGRTARQEERALMPKGPQGPVVVGRSARAVYVGPVATSKIAETLHGSAASRSCRGRHR